MLDFKGTLGAVDSATRALAAAKAVNVPWIRGVDSAVGQIRTHLESAATAFEQGAAIARTDAAASARLLDEAAASTRELAAAAQSRRGVSHLGERLAPIDAQAVAIIKQVKVDDRLGARTRMRTALGASYGEMTPARWRHLAAIAARPAARRPAGLQFATGGSMRDHLRQVADIVERGGKIKRDWAGWRILNRLRAEGRYSAERAEARLRELVAKPRTELTRDELHDLDGILQLPESRRPAALAGISHAKVAEAAELRATGTRIKADWDFFRKLDQVQARLDFPDRTASTRGAARALRRSYDDMTSDDWRELARIASLPPEVRPVAFQHASGTSLEQHLRDIAAQLDAGKGINSKWGGFTVLNRRRALVQFRTLDSATTRLHEIVKKPRSELTRQDLHDLDGILQLPAERRPVEAEGIALSTWAEAAELRGRGTPIADNWGGWSRLNRMGARAWWPDRTAATAAAHRYLGESYDAMSYASWQQLAHIANLPDDIRPQHLRHVTGESMATHLREISRMVRDGTTPNAKWSGWHHLNRIRAQARFGTAELADLRLREIATTPRARLTRQDWHDLDGLAQLPRKIRPAALRDLPARDISEAGELRGVGRRIRSDWSGWAAHDAAAIEYRLPADGAARADWVRAQLRRRTAGEGADPILGTLLRNRPDLIPDDMLETARLAIANELLRDIAEVGVTSSTASRPALEAAKRALSGWVPQDPAHQPIAKQSIELIDRNLRRMRSTANFGEGYLDHPDYAEVGRVRSNIDLLEQLDAAGRRPTIDPSGQVAVAPVETASPTGDATAGTVEEVLTW